MVSHYLDELVPGQRFGSGTRIRIDVGSRHLPPSPILSHFILKAFHLPRRKSLKLCMVRCRYGTLWPGSCGRPNHSAESQRVTRLVV